MTLQARQSAPSPSSSADEFLNLISNPFQSQIQVNSIYASLIWAFAVSGALLLTFVLLRPRIASIYAPRAQQADPRHAPPKLKNTAFGWTRAVRGIDEYDLVDRIGMDAAVFLRFLRMLRNLFLIFTVLGCAILIPLNLVGTHGVYADWGNVAMLLKFTPQYVFGQRFWVYVLLAYSFQLILFHLIWQNYRVVLDLRRRYFDSAQYRQDLTSRTLLIRYIPPECRNEEGIAELCDEALQTQDLPVPAAARNVHELPTLIAKHDHAVKKLEGHLAKYFARPETKPDIRPQCKVARDDREEYGRVRVDAIEYLQQRIAKLRLQIDRARKSVDSADVANYGFASFTCIEDAHATAYAARKKGPRGTNIILAPSPDDLIWRNLSMSRSTRRARIFWDGGCMLLLTIAYIPFNVISSAFLSDFSKLGRLWSRFDTDLSAHPVGWGVVQGILAPLFQYIIFLGLPSVFRRLYNHAGDTSKTSRERHVMGRLYAFFLVNNLIVFSVFATGFRFLASVLEAKDKQVWDAIADTHVFGSLMAGLCDVSTFWLTYQMQQNLGAAVDMAQLRPLLRNWFTRRLTHPTPRRRLEASAPRPLDYASYFNNYLFVSTVGLCFGVLQPLIFPITAFYLTIESVFKSYTVQYVSLHPHDSGGLFFAPLVNRLLTANLLATAVIALAVAAQAHPAMLYAMLPLPLLTAAFKCTCDRLFALPLRYASTTPRGSDIEGWDGPFKPRDSGSLSPRFRHPALRARPLSLRVDAGWEPRLAALLHPSLLADLSDRADGDLFLGQHEPGPQGSQWESAEPPGPMRVLRDPLEPLEVHGEGAAEAETRFQRRAEGRDAYSCAGDVYARADGQGLRSGSSSMFGGSWEAGEKAGEEGRGMDEVSEKSGLDEAGREAEGRDEGFEEIHVGDGEERRVERGAGQGRRSVADIEAARMYAEEVVRAGRNGGARGA